MDTREQTANIIEVLREIKRYKNPIWKYGHAKLALEEISKLKDHLELDMKNKDITEWFKKY